MFAGLGGPMGKLMSTLPVIPGVDFAGRVIATHADETVFRENQFVFGALSKPSRFGTLGKHIIIPTSQCAVVPEGVELSQAAAAGTAALTSYQALSYGGSTIRGQQVFINGGGGGTGTFAIQFAKAQGARVTTTCSTNKAELCKSLGADEILNYCTVDIVSELSSKGQRFDLAIDNVGLPNDLYRQSHTFLKPSGTFVQVSATLSVSGMASILAKAIRSRFPGGAGRRFHFLTVESKQDDLVKIGQWLSNGAVKCVIDEIVEYNDVKRAFAKLADGHARGKIIVRCNDQTGSSTIS
ncbi:hypothetical protein NQ176_g1093 [Zarea fungicola]|uniref:Uncharacterized protein n=1 Tax=Zarea fungicola TaxID=93591 RepID=A0ACC1NVC3_9HYPO|nr:hypothetical protein NQ176_g1093 [Lecanicillium fungicola]